MRINVTPQQLTLFLRVAATGSFSEAARTMGISQPALSRTIKALENTLGERLFDRDTRNVHLTPAGAALRPLAERLVAEFTGGFGELARFVAGRTGRILVAALPSVAAVLLPDALARFQAEHPEVEVVILDGLSGSIAEAVATGRAEIGITVQSPLTTALAYQPLLTDGFGLVCKSEDPLARSGKQDWSVFGKHRFIAMAPTSSVRMMTDAAFLQCGLAVPQLFGCSFLGTAGHLVARGLGITALPELTLPLAAASGLAWRPLQRPLLRRQIGTVVRRGRSLTPATRRLLELLTEGAERAQSLLSP
jgi:LysR family carnitine catabolism transcriptional activator